MKTNNNNGSFVPAIIYNNADIDKSIILSDNKDKSGIYLWTHKESGKTYVGSAVNLSKRLKNYFLESYLSQNKSMHIYNALLHHTHSAYSLTILEYIDISNLSKDEARKLILEREQHYIDLLNPIYNILKKAGSSLGYKHTQESLAKLSLANLGEAHPFYGKFHSEETIAFLSEINKGENHPSFGKSASAETVTKQSIAKGGGTIFVHDTQ